MIWPTANIKRAVIAKMNNRREMKMRTAIHYAWPTAAALLMFSALSVALCPHVQSTIWGML